MIMIQLDIMCMLTKKYTSYRQINDNFKFDLFRLNSTMYSEEEA